MEWDPTQFFRADDPPTPFALVVLNQPINEKAFAVLKGHACITVCADGGANHYYDLMKRQGREALDLPSLIIGDLDSISPDVRSHYTDLGVSVIEDRDQYSTDFTKCLNYLRSHAHEIVGRGSDTTTSTAIAPSSESTGPGSRTTPVLNTLILGGLGGRVDQAFSQIHHLYTMTQEMQHQQQQGPTQEEHEKQEEGNLYLISEESITFILRPGKNVIRTPGTNRPLPPSTTSTTTIGGGAAAAAATPSSSSLIPSERPLNEGENHLLEENVGIIPLSGPARITTSGLQWDVTDWATEIGGQLSTSNHIRADVVEVESQVPVLFTVELARRFKRTR
ncbi:thiamine diphosphokinase [Aspergillus melleus]|uniref:thiamine diphosphokinase n=1 Tax=Aspergillus melleus TaxID=138277 RepID=UPI001E8DB588|nr:thiamine pyrophosphokinase [Aspergillus melleus]KAH8423640.1 thiamine pyrophosphokinase [Aspergillus melleus]